MENGTTKDITLEYYENNILARCYKIRLIYVVFRREQFSKNQFWHSPMYPNHLNIFKIKTTISWPK